MDGLLININTRAEIDLDLYYGIADIKKIVNIEDNFYIMGNKRFSKLGYYLLQIDMNDPLANIDFPKEVEKQFLINYSNKLDIGDVDIFAYTNKKKNQKELIVSYKSIYINIYNLIIIDCNTGCIDFKHESFCLWENNLMSFFNSVTEDFITLR